MKNQRRPNRAGTRFGRVPVFVVLVPGLLAFWLLASAWFPPIETPVRALYAPPTPDAQAASSPAVNGTLASFTALFPQLEMLYLPSLTR